jgi:Lrp/AsnC family transcriptional regulator for asnA, asnC and gidA
MRTSFDALDLRIIRLLQSDARLSSAEIARQLGVSERTVRHRITRLTNAQAIIPTVVVNPKVFGYQTAVDVFCEVEVHLMEQVSRALARLPEVNYVAFSTGDQDLSIQALLESTDRVYDFIQEVARVPGVRRTRTVLVPRVIKDTYMWTPPDCDFQEYSGDLEPESVEEM